MADLDVITQMEETARRRRLLDALSKSQQDAPLVGKGGPTQAALKVVSALLNQYSQGKLGEQDAANRAQYNQQLGQETNSYLDRMQGKPGQVLSDQQASALMNNDQDPGPLAEPVQRNPREAMVRALTSNLPEMQQLGRASMAQLGKQEDEKFGHTPVLMKGADGKLVNVLLGDRGTQRVVQGMTPATKQEATAAGHLFDPYQGTQTGYVGDKYGPQQTVNGEAVQFEQSSGKAHQIANRPPQTTVNANTINKGETEFSKTLGKDVAEEFKGARQAAQQGYKTLSTVQQLRELDSKGVFQGPTANLALTLGQFGSTLGMPVDAAKLANSEAYQRQFSKEIAQVLMQGGGVGRSMTDEDRKRFEASLPSMLQSPQGRAQIYGQLEQESQRSIQRAASFQKQLSSNPLYKDTAGMLTMNPVDSPTLPPQAPAVPGQPAGTGRVMSWQEYLGREQ
jgi:hypothetical protein